MVRGLHQLCQAQGEAGGQQDDVTAAHLASHVVILTTVDYRLITARLVNTAVLHKGCAILHEKAPHTFVISRIAVSQILALVAF